MYSLHLQNTHIYIHVDVCIFICNCSFHSTDIVKTLLSWPPAVRPPAQPRGFSKPVPGGDSGGAGVPSWCIPQARPPSSTCAWVSRFLIPKRCVKAWGLRFFRGAWEVIILNHFCSLWESSLYLIQAMAWNTEDPASVTAGARRREVSSQRVSEGGPP